MKALSIHLEAVKKSHFIFLRWLRLVFAFAILSTIMLCCAPKTSRPISSQAPEDSPSPAAQNAPAPSSAPASAAAPADPCQIPPSAKIIHYPMIHSLDEDTYHDLTYPSSDERFLEEAVIHSQFQLARLIERLPDTHIFSEGALLSWGPEHFAQRDRMSYVIIEGGQRVSWALPSIQKTFHRGLPERVQDLNTAQKKILFKLGGVPAAFAIGTTTAFYRVISPDENDKVQSRIQSLYNERAQARKSANHLLDQLRESPGSLYLKAGNEQMKASLREKTDDLSEINQKLNKWTFDEREAILKREVESLLSQSNKKVLIAFGAAHDLSDDFKNYSFFALPEKCTMPAAYLSHPYYAFGLIRRADRISKDRKSSSKQLTAARLDYKKAHLILSEAVKQYRENSDETTYWYSYENRYYTKEEIEIKAQRSEAKYNGEDLHIDYYLASSKTLRFN